MSDTRAAELFSAGRDPASVAARAGRDVAGNVARFQASQESRRQWSQVMAVVEASALRAVELATPEQVRMGTVVSFDPGSSLTRLKMDDGMAAEAINAGGGYLLPGQRVWVQYFQPQGAMIVAQVEEAWSFPTVFSAPWVAGTPAPRYRRDAAGNVHLQGSVSTPGATATASLFTLAARHLPSRTLTFTVWLSAGLAYPVTVSTLGVVSIPGGSGAATSISLDGIVFLAEA